jgi:hypothetical protein
VISAHCMNRNLAEMDFCGDALSGVARVLGKQTSPFELRCCRMRLRPRVSPGTSRRQRRIDLSCPAQGARQLSEERVRRKFIIPGRRTDGSLQQHDAVKSGGEPRQSSGQQSLSLVAGTGPFVLDVYSSLTGSLFDAVHPRRGYWVLVAVDINITLLCHDIYML